MSDHRIDPSSPQADTAQSTPLPVGPPRYEFLAEIAHGGMGTVYRVHDIALNRDVAIKVFHSRFQTRKAAARRFIDEAKITGQLQHPGIPAVHELGSLPDGRPFLAMKLIRGDTLDELLKARPDPAHDRGRFIAIFEQMCQAMGYAHARQVIHRDLKPANIMVGSFGEVQVMDWGLAKVLASQERTEPTVGDPEKTAALTEIDTDSDEDSATRAGSVLGTPAYMPPEQAIGAIEQIDTRSDVFGLGAILCAILTGKPPYVGADSESTRQLAARAKLDDAFHRLDACGAEPELVGLCKRCLSLERSERSAHAGEVAEAVAGLRAAADERARLAELERVRVEGERAAAEARAEEEAKTRRVAEEKAVEQRKRRRMQLALVGALIVIAAGGGAFVWWQDHQASERRNEKQREEGEQRELAMTRQYEDERRAADERAMQTRNNDALAASLERCETALRRGQGEVAAAALADVEKRLLERGTEAFAARSLRCRVELAMLDALDQITDFRWTPVKGARLPETAALASRLETAFAGFGIVPETTPTTEGARRVSEAMIRDRLLAGLDLWLLCTAKQAIADLLHAADPDDYRNAFRSAVVARDWPRAEKLLHQDEAMKQPPGFAVAMGTLSTLPKLRQREVLERVVVYRPDDLSVLMALAFTYPIDQPEGPANRVRWYQAAVASHPRNAAAWLNLGVALRLKGDVDGAINAYHAALNINPQYALAYNNLALVLKEKKNFDGAVRAFEEALRINPKYALAHTNLGLLYHARGDLDGAIGAYQAAIKSDPQYVDAHYCLGIALRDKRDVRGAIASYREAIKVDAKYADAHNNLAYILASGPDEVRDGRLAVEHATRACELTDWKNPRPIATLSFAYAEIGDFDKANKYLEHALTFPAFLKETGPGAQVTLGKYARKQPYRDPTLALSKPHEPAPPPREVKRP